MRVCNMFSLRTAGVVGPLCTSLWAPQQFFFNTFLHLGFDYGTYPPLTMAFGTELLTLNLAVTLTT